MPAIVAIAGHGDRAQAPPPGLDHRLLRGLPQVAEAMFCVQKQDAVFRHDADDLIMPIREATLNVVPVTSSARNPPKVESSADPKIAVGEEKVLNSNNSTANRSKQSQQQHHQQIARRFPILLIQAAIFNTD